MRWMKRPLFKTLVFALILLTGFSDTTLAQKKSKSSLLWEISGNGLKQPSYLYGTIHIICKDDFVMSETLKQKFSASGKIYLELDMDDPKMQVTMMQQMQLPKGETLKEKFGESNYQLVDSFMRREMKMNLSAFNSFKPLMVMSLLTQRMLPCTTTESYEMSFVKMAREQKKEVLGLETVADQLGVFDAVPDSLEVKNLVDMVTDFEKHKKNFAEMVSIYKAQNLKRLYRYTTESPDLMGSKELLLDRRNRNWITGMEAAMQQGSTFFAVGAAHLPGDVGVIQLLREKGYKVKAVKQ